MAKKVDVEKLIELVRDNPRNPLYKDEIRTRNIWNSIGKRFNITG